MKTASATILAVGIVVALTSLPGSARTIFKYVTPDGRTVYSDSPVAGARLVEELVPVPPAAPAPSTVPKAAAPQADAPAPAAPSRTQMLDAAWREFNDAAAALEEGKRRLEAGREPLPGERIGTATRGKGGQNLSRLTDEYWARQQANEQSVAKAQQRLDKARTAWEAVR